jgi:hypothetical protein
VFPANGLAAVEGDGAALEGDGADGRFVAVHPVADPPDQPPVATASATGDVMIPLVPCIALFKGQSRLCRLL